MVSLKPPASIIRPLASGLVIALFFLVGTVRPAEGQTAETILTSPTEGITGDLSEMRRRNKIRVLISHNKTNFFRVMGHKRGFEYELLERYERFLNKGITKKNIKMDIVYIPIPFKRLIPALLKGEGDIAAAGLTITPERQKKVTFTVPYLPNVDEIVVASEKIKGLNVLEDLSGRTIYVLRASSYVQHLRRLNGHLRKKGRPPIKIVEASENLATEDILEMVNAGIVDLTVADRHIAELWSGVLTKIVRRGDLKINTGGQIGWAVRRENPELLKSLNAFIKKIKKGTLIGNILFKRYYKNAKWIKNPLAERERQKFERFRLNFKKYGKRYGVDWIALEAQAYQESGLDNSKRSPRGAIGIMQVLPRTAADPNVNIRDIHKLENNIHAGVKYLSFLRKKYFNDPGISPADRIFFSFAAYNAGPARVRQLRNRAKSAGLDPNKWFFNVERAALEVIGQETVRYVANIHKYYIAYKLLAEANAKKAAELKASQK